ncbi:B12-binding domain-containing radical SAM protein [Lyngbya confervoides]|uniref:B12-binding domain-containing radical SAM protein n=1 Tax=Lyngbya confervoides BDU141951 TaxID=1574623 RepID=A0ABD4T406_9CYAN|nr:B12-binding domain-containing radical SAM protein [Lyngbya confervoides]MCM1983345.1 B12-binding domain-containing radical SAM protein [Lyngbya confervoides BDU141951]
MRVLLIYPEFPQSFWSFEQALQLVDRKALLPPLGLITVAAILPQDWEFKLVDRNVRAVSEAEWDWAELVIVSAMIVQSADFKAQVQEAKRRQIPVAVGGPYPTSLPEEAEASGADYLVLDEGEVTLPLFLEALARGDASGLFRSAEKPDVTLTPIPRYDLLEMDAYDNMSVQFSRGCPFQCEFCDIIVLYGRKPRTKTPEQLLGELQRLYDLGWRRSIFLVDDNFIGNKRNVKLMLRALKPWMEEHQYPFHFNTEASVDLAADSELMDLMVGCNFNAVFLGIETPDTSSLDLTQKFQNTRTSLDDSVAKIMSYGLRVTAGFIIGFDNEKAGAGDRIIRFVEDNNITLAMFSMLQALPNTALWARLEKEGRIVAGNANINQTTLMNFIPTRPVETIAQEYVRAFWELYDPLNYLDRTYRQFLAMGEPRHRSELRRPNWSTLRALVIVCWRQGIVRKTRWKFWLYLAHIFRRKPGHWQHYLSICALGEHFLEYRQQVRSQIQSQLETYLQRQSPVNPAEAAVPAILEKKTA